MRISKIARPKRIIWTGDLPKTRSGKIMRRLLRDIAEGRELGDVTTLRDPDDHGAARGEDPGAPGERGRRLARDGGGRRPRPGDPAPLRLHPTLDHVLRRIESGEWNVIGQAVERFLRNQADDFGGHRPRAPRRGQRANPLDYTWASGTAIGSCTLVDTCVRPPPRSIPSARTPGSPPPDSRSRVGDLAGRLDPCSLQLDVEGGQRRPGRDQVAPALGCSSAGPKSGRSSPESSRRRSSASPPARKKARSRRD